MEAQSSVSLALSESIEPNNQLVSEEARDRSPALLSPSPPAGISRQPPAIRFPTWCVWDRIDWRLRWLRRILAPSPFPIWHLPVTESVALPPLFEGSVMPQSQRLLSTIPPAPFERPACPRCKASMMLSASSQNAQAWTCIRLSAPSAVRYLQRLARTKILCIPRPLAAGSKAICIRRSNARP